MNYYKIKNEEIINARGVCETLYMGENETYVRSENALQPPFESILPSEMPVEYEQIQKDKALKYADMVLPSLTQKIRDKIIVYPYKTHLVDMAEEDQLNLSGQIIAATDAVLDIPLDKNIYIRCILESGEKQNIALTLQEAKELFLGFTAKKQDLLNKFSELKSSLLNCVNEEEAIKLVNQFKEGLAQ